MPKIRTLSAEEIARYKKPRAPRPDLLQPYVDYLRGVEAGRWSALEMEAGETQRAVKRRLTTAGKSMGKKIKYRKGADGTLVFEVSDLARTGDEEAINFR